MPRVASSRNLAFIFSCLSVLLLNVITVSLIAAAVVVDAVMSVTGIFGNLSVCCVILRFPGMRSATNYYLFSLAVADLLILLLGELLCGKS